MTRWTVPLAVLATATLLWAQAQPQPGPQPQPQPEAQPQPGPQPPALDGGAGPRRSGPLLEDADTNGDCIIDDTEARLAAEKRVEAGRKLIERLRQRSKDNPDAPYPPLAAELDTDRNYEVSDAEAQAAVQRIMAELQKRNAIVLKYFDTDKDGKLSPAEQATAKTAFDFMNEIRAGAADRLGPMIRNRLADGPRQGGGRGQGAGRGPRDGRQPRPQPQPEGAAAPPAPAAPVPPPAEKAP